MSTAKGRGGKKGRRAKNTSNDVKRELVFKEEEQEYAQVLKMLGGGRCDLFCFDGVKRLGSIRGKLIKRVWIQTGDIVLISLRDFQKEGKKCDIVHKYFPDEAKKLKAYKEIPESVDIATGEAQEADAHFMFGDEEGSEGSEEEEQQDNRREMPEISESDEDEEDSAPVTYDKNYDKRGKDRKKSDDSVDDI